MPKITKRFVDASAPRATGDYFKWDDEVKGFGLRVRPNGRKSYWLQYRDAGGATKRILIGEHGALTPDQARATAAQLRGEVLATRRDPNAADPAGKRTRAKRAAKEALEAPTVAQVADAFLTESAAKLKRSTVYEYQRLLGEPIVSRGPTKGERRAGELRREFGDCKVAEVTRSQVGKLHLEMKDRPYMANRALAALKALFTYAERHGHRAPGTNPCVGVDDYREDKRERYLKEPELAAINAALEKGVREGLPLPARRKRARATEATRKHRAKNSGQPVPLNPVGVGALRFLLLTGWRKSEALSLRWMDIDRQRGTVLLANTKTGRSNRYLSTHAAEVIESMLEYRQVGNPYVFPGAVTGKPYSDLTRVWDMVRHEAGVPDVRLHDLRHSYATFAAAAGQDLQLIGALLGHRNVATTARYAHLFPERQQHAAEATGGAVAAALASKGIVASPAEIRPLRAQRRNRRAYGDAGD
jgi:integrase